MSLIFCDGFDDGITNQKWNLGYGSGCSVVTGGRTGKRLQLADVSYGQVRRQVAAADEHATFIWGFALQANAVNFFDQSNFYSGMGNAGSVLSDSGTVTHVSIGLEGGNTNVSPRVTAWRGMDSNYTGGTLLGSGPVAPWVINNWYYIECKVVASNTVGSVTVKINGTTVLSLTGIDTLNGGTKTVYDSFGIATITNYNNGVVGWYDDLYLCNGAGSINNDFLGDIAIETLLPSGDGSSSQWVGSDGNSVNNSLLVDEAGAPDTTDYVQDGTVGERDLYAYSNLATTSGPVFGMQIASHAQASASGARNLKNIVKSSATVAASGTKALTTTWAPALSIQETDPSTSAAWDIAGVNAAEIGVEVA